MFDDFTLLNKQTFLEKFSSEEDCLKYLAEYKWKNGFVCKKCGHTHFCSGRYKYSRRCTKCKFTETAQANTVFANCKIPLNIAFQIVYDVINNPHLSCKQLFEKYSLRQMTCWRIKKIAEIIKQNNFELLTLKISENYENK